MNDPTGLKSTLLFTILAVLTLSGIPGYLQHHLLILPARSVTFSLEESAEKLADAVEGSCMLADSLTADQRYEDYSSYFMPLSDALDFGVFATTVASVAVHVINIYLILSGPLGKVLLTVLFILLAIIPHVRKDRRLRNAAMATGTAAWVFWIAIPLAVVSTGQLTRIYTAALRFSTELRLAEFIQDGDCLLAEDFEPEDPRREMILLVKGLQNYAGFAAGSLLLDVIALPVFLSWIYYRLGILVANTIFGSLHLEKLGTALNGCFKEEENEGRVT